MTNNNTCGELGNCNQDVRNGLNSIGNGIHSSRRKSKEHQQLFMNENDYRKRLQEILYAPEYIFTKIFRKDGPSLGDQFDCLPSNAFSFYSRKSYHDNNNHANKRRKTSSCTILDYETCWENWSPAKKHGIGKGPMTAMGASTRKFGMGKGLMTQSEFLRGAKDSDNSIQKKKKRTQPQESVVGKLARKERATRKSSLRIRKAECRKVKNQKKHLKEKCELALKDAKCLEYMQQFAMLVDDEELEIRELRAGPNAFSCSAHVPTNGSKACSLCKDLLAKFPPKSITMKIPLSTQPWATVPELVNKLFKAFHFLCTYAIIIGIRSFTLDEFAGAFQEKGSLLLGQVHLALLNLFLSDINKELSRGRSSHANKNCKFLHLLDSLERSRFVLEFWQKSLNSMTWTEILCQVLVAAGFTSKPTLKAACSKEASLVEKYGISPGSLRGELFSILLAQGSDGMEVSELSKSSSIVQLHLTDKPHDLENLITSSLLGDISLFEKISSSRYRVRIHAAEKECEYCHSDSDNFGSIDEISEISGGNDANDSEDEYMVSSPSKTSVSRSSTNMLSIHNEIDESLPAEAWLLTLMEAEYTDLSIEEKLNALDSLIDLVSVGFSIRMEEMLMSSAECHPSTNYGSGAKIKKSRTKQCGPLGPLGRCLQQTSCEPDVNTEEQPVDSFFPMSKISGEEMHVKMEEIAKQMEVEDCLHPMQSIFLGSDRRYNRYWLFLGPCDEIDPGHRRIYFESSDDGHWEVIDAKENLAALLSALDHRGKREARLLASLEKIEAILSQAMSITTTSNRNMVQGDIDPSKSTTSRESSSSPVSDVDNRVSFASSHNELLSGYKGEQTVEKSGHSKAFDEWIWNSFYSELNTVKNGNKAYLNTLRKCDQCQDLYWRDEKHCRICHTTFELDFGLEERYTVHLASCKAIDDGSRCRTRRVLSSRLQALKAGIYAIESAIPEDAMLGSWKKSSQNLWVNRLRRASTLREFEQVLTDFVSAINGEWFYRNNVLGPYFAPDNIFSNFSTMVRTYSAAALWLVKLDILVASSVDISGSQNKYESNNRIQVQ